MPIVRIDLKEGRSKEQLAKMVEEVTAAISKTAGAPKENIHILVNEMKKDSYSVGGKWSN